MKKKKAFRLLTTLTSTVLVLLISTYFIKTPQSIDSEAKTEQQPCWISFGPLGTPNATWDTAEEILVTLNTNGILARSDTHLDKHLGRPHHWPTFQ